MPSRPDYPAFARLLRSALERSGRTGTWLADRLGFTQQHASDIVTGKHKPPILKIEAMAELLGLEGDARQWFLDEAYLTHSPDFIRARQARGRDLLQAAMKTNAALESEVALLTREIRQLQRAAADLAALRAAVAGLVDRYPVLAAELQEPLVVRPPDEPSSGAS